MAKAVLFNEKGVTLVEIVISCVVMLLVSLALMQTALLGIETNFRNVLRDGAVRIGEMRMHEARNICFAKLFRDVEDDIPDDNLVLDACQRPPVNDPRSYPVKVIRPFRNITNFSYGTRREVTDMGADMKQVTILVRWVYKDECSTHSVSSIVRNN